MRSSSTDRALDPLGQWLAQPSAKARDAGAGAGAGPCTIAEPDTP